MSVLPIPRELRGTTLLPQLPRTPPPGEPHRPSTASTTRPEISISQSELSMRSRRSGRRARLMTNTWRRQGRWVREGWVQRKGRAHPLLDPSSVGGGNLPHQTPSCWVSLGAGTRALRPAWGARPLQRKVPPIMNPYWLLSTVTLQSPCPPFTPAPSEHPGGRALRNHRIHPPPSYRRGHRGLARRRTCPESGTKLEVRPGPQAHCPVRSRAPEKGPKGVGGQRGHRPASRLPALTQRFQD